MVYAGRIWLKEWRKKSWTSTGSNKAKERLSEVEVPLGMEEGTQKQEIQNKKVEGKIAGQELQRRESNQGGVNGRRRRDEAAAKNGNHERSDKENKIKRKNGR